MEEEGQTRTVERCTVMAILCRDALGNRNNGGQTAV